MTHEHSRPSILSNRPSSSVTVLRVILQSRNAGNLGQPRLEPLRGVSVPGPLRGLGASAVVITPLTVLATRRARLTSSASSATPVVPSA